MVDDNSYGHHGFVIDAGPPGDDWRALEEPDSDSEPWWTLERVVLVRWLNRCAPALVPYYLGALRLAVLDSFHGRVHFIAHAIREICNRLPGALGPEVKRRDAGYEPLTDKIRDQWVAENLPEDGRLRISDESVPSASGPLRQEVSVELLESVGRLIADHNDAKANRLAREQASFSDLTNFGTAPAFARKVWQKRKRDAHKFAHAADYPRPPESDQEWVKRFEELERDLIAMSRPAQQNLDELDELLAEANKR
ncbi:MAG: hypothetical protein F4Z28_04195 [Gammaproteobacteria bacterium]|nr:hypothetical protein [Gammaproteobacteria bacterium]